MAVVSYTAGRAQSVVPLTRPDAGVVAVSFGTVEVATIGDATSTYTMCKIPGNSLIVGGWVAGDTTLEANATETLVLDVGVTGAATILLNGVVQQINDASRVINQFGYPPGVYIPIYSHDGAYDVGTTDVDLIVTVQTAAGTTGTGTISACVFYTTKPYPVAPAQTTDA